MIIFEALDQTHWPIVKKIYEEGIATGNATFQLVAPEWNEWDNNHLPHSRIIAKEADTILGWAALTPVSGRCIYAGVAEVSVYVSDSARGKGFGNLLLEKLIEESEANNTWTLQAGIFPENMASISLHKKYGFRVVGRRERIGKMNGIWRDTMLLERRSEKVGL